MIVRAMRVTILRRVAPGLEALLAYDTANLRNDVVAGLSVAAVALPVGIAYSDIAHVPAVAGIYSAIFPLFAYALFGSSRQLMTGPDAATCIMAAASVGAVAGSDPERYGSLMIAMTLLTGVLYMAAGILRLGFIANFLSQPILVGYLNGVALLVLIGQVPKLFGVAGGGDGFFPQLTRLVGQLGATHLPTLALGLSLVAVMITLRRVSPRVPAPLVAAVLGVAAVAAFDLANSGVAVLGAVTAGVPVPHLPSIAPGELSSLTRDALGLTLISFTSGVLTSKSFARRNHYDVDANQELIGFGACNLASGLVQGFPVTGADSRTAVNNAMGGRTQLVGVVAGGTMLLFLLFLTGPLASLPSTALAAIILVSAYGLFDFPAVGTLRHVSVRELLFSLITTAGVLLLGVLPGVLLAVVVSLLWLLWLMSWPHDAVLGRVPGMPGLHDLRDYPHAVTIPGLLVYRFNANLLFFNCDYLKDRVRQHVRDASTPVEWVVIDASPINIVDYTATQKVGELRRELQARGIVLGHAGAKRALARFFKPGILGAQDLGREHDYPTLDAAVAAFERRHQSTPTDGAKP